MLRDRSYIKETEGAALKQVASTSTAIVSKGESLMDSMKTPINDASVFRFQYMVRLEDTRTNHIVVDMIYMIIFRQRSASRTTKICVAPNCRANHGTVWCSLENFRLIARGEWGARECLLVQFGVA